MKSGQMKCTLLVYIHFLQGKFSLMINYLIKKTLIDFSCTLVASCLLKVKNLFCVYVSTD